MQSLDGSATVTGHDGAISGFNAEQLLKRLERRPLSGGGNFRNGSTPYDNLTIAVKFADGIATTEDVRVEGPTAKLTLTGTASVPAREYDLKGVASLIAAQNGGTAFDLPHLRKLFPGWQPPAAHVDLCILLRRLGEAGGLKQIEPRLGLHRPPHLAPLSGTDAVWLWRAQREGDRAALRRLLEYNLHDAFHLRPIAEIAYNRMLRRSRMPATALPVTERGALLYDVSRAVERALQ